MRYYRYTCWCKKLASFFCVSKRPYRLLEIDAHQHVASFHLKNKSMVFKCSLEEAIVDKTLIKGLSPQEACWLGGYYGRALRHNSGRTAIINTTKHISFKLRDIGGRYKMVFQDRDGTIGYLDKKTRKEFKEHPLATANSQVISEFDATQACYIGILAGISFEKATSLDKKDTSALRLTKLMSERPNIRLVS